jgi:hypothetical protein
MQREEAGQVAQLVGTAVGDLVEAERPKNHARSPAVQTWTKVRLTSTSLHSFTKQGAGVRTAPPLSRRGPRQQDRCVVGGTMMGEATVRWRHGDYHEHGGAEGARHCHAPSQSARWAWRWAWRWA